jgi:6-phosphofructokinase 2
MDTLIVALNPSIDAEWRVNRFCWEEKNQVLLERRWAGGKGVNVARWLRHLGGRPRLLLPLGGITGEELRGLLRSEGLPALRVPVAGSTRVNVIVTTRHQGQMRFNPLGPTLSRREWREVEIRFRAQLSRASLVVLSGSLPRGVPIDAYARLLRHARKAGVRTILDCDGPAFAAAVAERPFLVKPNEHELAGWIGKPLKSSPSYQIAARTLADETGGWVLLSRGCRGAWLLNSGANEPLSQDAPRIRAVNTVGAGDAMLAGGVFAMLQNDTPRHWLQAAVRAGSAAVRCPGGRLPKSRADRPPVSRENSEIAAPRGNRRP